MSGISVTRPNLHFFQYIQAYKPFADTVPPNTKQFQLILTKYQPLSSYPDLEPSNTTYNSLSRKAQFSQQNGFRFYDTFDEWHTVYLVYFWFDFWLSRFLKIIYWLSSYIGLRDGWRHQNWWIFGKVPKGGGSFSIQKFILRIKDLYTFIKFYEKKFLMI